LILSPTFVLSENFIPNHVCDDIVKRGLSLQEHDGVLQGDKEDKQIRNSRVVWLDDTWIYDWISPHIEIMNKQIGWNVDFSTPEEIQFTKYKEGQFYGWHQDHTPKVNEENITQRKVSVVVPLSDSSDYDGGDLEFYDSVINPDISNDKKILKDERTRQRGTIIVFPSFAYHRVTKVTRGERLSIVIWYKGELWK
jgi:PKHD-type hydroxylase